MKKAWELTKAITIIFAAGIGCFIVGFIVAIILGAIIKAFVWAFVTGYNLL